MRAALMSNASLLLCASLTACSSAHEPPDAAIVVDATVTDGGADAAEPDTGPRLDVSACAGFDVPLHTEMFGCAPSTAPGGDCAALHDGPAFAVVGRDLCAEALASGSGAARVQFSPAVEVLDVGCDGLVLAARTGPDRVRIDFHGYAQIADALANDAPYAVEAEATSGPEGCVATLFVRAVWNTIVLGELPATGGQLSFGTGTTPTTIDVAPLYAPGESCVGQNAACVTASYDSPDAVAVSFCSASVASYACSDYDDYFAMGTTACDARLRVGATVRSAVRICH